MLARRQDSPWQSAFGWVGATGRRSIDLKMGNGGSILCHIRHTFELFLAGFHPPHCGRIPTFILPVYFNASVSANPEEKYTMMKTLIAAGATLALVTATGAADLPRPQPVPPQPAYVGKAPIGKEPIGKTPIGKAPAPVVSKY